MKIKRFIVNMLESLCSILDACPSYEAWSPGERRTWNRYGDWGCRLTKLATWSDSLDQRWGTGVWKSVEP